MWRAILNFEYLNTIYEKASQNVDDIYWMKTRYVFIHIYHQDNSWSQHIWQEGQYTQMWTIKSQNYKLLGHTAIHIMYQKRL